MMTWWYSLDGHFQDTGNRMSLFYILLELRMMAVVVTAGAVRYAKLQSNRHQQQTNTQFFTNQMPFLSLNQQCQNTGGKSISFQGLAHPKLTWRVVRACLWPLKAAGYLEGVLSSLSSALWHQYPNCGFEIILMWSIMSGFGIFHLSSPSLNHLHLL